MYAWTCGTAARGAVLVVVGSLLWAGGAQAQLMDRSTPRAETTERAAALPSALEAPGWETGGIYGGDVTALAISGTVPGEVLAAVRCANAVPCVLPAYMSKDLGGSWGRDPVSLTGHTEFTRAVSTTDGWLMLAGPAGLRVRMALGGWITASFQPSSLGTRRPVDLAVSRKPYGPTMVAMAASDTGPGLLATSTGRIAFYQDKTPAAAVGLDASAVAIHPEVFERRAVAFIGAQGQPRVFVTVDGGEQWLERVAGLPVGKIVTLTYQNNRLLALVEGHGIYGSESSASHWLPMAIGHSAFRTATRMEVSPDDPQILWLATPRGLSRTANSGLTWQHQVPGTRNLEVLDISASIFDADVVMIGVRRWGVLTSLDGGQSFMASTNGLQNLNVSALAAHPADPRRMAAIVQGSGIEWHVDSHDAGTTWQLGGWLPQHVRSLHFDGQGRLHALIRADDDAPATLHRLQDGRAWQQMTTPVQGADIREVHFDVSRPGLIRLAGSDAIGSSGRATLWTSVNDGRDWQVTWQGRENDVATQILGFSDAGEDWLMVPTRNRDLHPGVVGISADGGRSWRETVMGWPGGDRRIVLCRHEGSRTIHALGGGLQTFDLDSGNVEWTWLGGIPGYVSAGFLCGDPATEELFAGSRQGLDFRDPVVRRVAGSQFEPYALDFPLAKPHRATQMILTPAGLFLASEIGLFRNRAPVHAEPPHSLQVSQTVGRMARFLELDFQAGATWVRVLRDGKEVAVVPNTGGYRERRLMDGTTPSYQVCNAFTEGCSAPATLAR